MVEDVLTGLNIPRFDWENHNQHAAAQLAETSQVQEEHIDIIQYREYQHGTYQPFQRRAYFLYPSSLFAALL